jgi:hypothetical protein
MTMAPRMAPGMLPMPPSVTMVTMRMDTLRLIELEMIEP